MKHELVYDLQDADSFFFLLLIVPYVFRRHERLGTVSSIEPYPLRRVAVSATVRNVVHTWKKKWKKKNIIIENRSRALRVVYISKPNGAMHYITCSLPTSL